jgi:hypothetical protein
MRASDWTERAAAGARGHIPAIGGKEGKIQQHDEVVAGVLNRNAPISRRVRLFGRAAPGPFGPIPAASRSDTAVMPICGLSHTSPQGGRAVSEIDNLKKRLTALEQENARLRKGSGPPKETVTVAGSYKGFPVLRFEGPFRPLTIGLKKLSVSLEKLEDVRFFVENNRHKLARTPDDDAEAA